MVISKKLFICRVIVNDLHKYDTGLIKKYGCNVLIGIDEAGRGPLAGPVAAAACVVPDKSAKFLNDARDSKKLSPSKRLEIYDKIKTCGAKYCVSLVHPCEIDKINILQAVFKAMSKAFNDLKIDKKNALIIIDGTMLIPNLKFKQIAIKSADDKSLAVACASIIAKVTRDRYMEKIDKIYPGYGFAKHKGYGTDMHYRALDKLGACKEHRRSFLNIWHCVEK